MYWNALWPSIGPAVQPITCQLSAAIEHSQNSSFQTPLPCLSLPSPFPLPPQYVVISLFYVRPTSKDIGLSHVLFLVPSISSISFQSFSVVTRYSCFDKIIPCTTDRVLLQWTASSAPGIRQYIRNYYFTTIFLNLVQNTQ